MARFSAREYAGVGVLSLALCVSIPPDVGRAVEAADSASLLAAAAFRQSLGLDASSATVARSLSSPEFSDSAFGTPLTEAEAAAVAVRAEYSWRFVPVVDEANASADIVGSYLDDTSGRVLTLLTPDNPAELQARLEPLVPAGGTLVVKHYPFTRAQVDEMLGSIARNFTDYGAHAAHFDPRTEHIVIGAPVNAPDAALSSAKALGRARFGEIVVAARVPKLSLLACSIADCGTRGGLEIRGKNGSNDLSWELCTSGFVVRNLSNAEMRMLTAGHCINNNGGAGATNSFWKNEAQTVTWGRNMSSAFFDGTDSDSGTYKLSPTIPTAKNTYYISSTSQPRIVVARTDAQQTVGMLVCRSGRTSNYDCGEIEIWHPWQEPLPGFILNKAIVVGMASDHGDSGAGFIGTQDEAGNRFAAGILSGGAGGWTWYTGVEAAQSRAGVKVCVTSAC